MGVRNYLIDGCPGRAKPQSVTNWWRRAAINGDRGVAYQGGRQANPLDGSGTREHELFGLGNKHHIWDV